MATVMDIGLLHTIDFIFPPILIFALVFALLHKFKVITDSVAINAFIAAVIGLMTLLSQTIIDIINIMIPWFVVAILFFILLLLFFFIFGAKEKDIFDYMKTDRGVGWVLVVIALAIVGVAVAQVMGQDIGPYLDEDGTPVEDSTTGAGDVATSSFEHNIMATLFHPKILALVVVFGIMIFAVGLLTGEAK